MIYCLILIAILLFVLVIQNSTLHRTAVATEQIAAILRELATTAETYDIREKFIEIHETVLMIQLQTAPEEEEPPFS